MTTDRTKNFNKADEALAKQWSTSDVAVTAKDIKNWRKENEYTWHELNDTKTMQLMPSKVNGAFSHLGGVGELKLE